MYHAEVLAVFIVASLAGLGLILFGTRMLSGGLQVIIAGYIRSTMNRLNESAWQSLSVGIFTSVMIQSRISASVMAVSYAGSGLMNLRQLTLVLLGTAVGTVISPWIFVFETGQLDLLLLAIGILPMLYARWDRLSGVGRIAFAFGLMLLGFDIIAFGSGNPDSILPIISHFLSTLSEYQWSLYWVLCCFGLFFSLVFRSTVALVGLVMAVVYSGVLNPEIAIMLTVGFNLGATAPPLFVSRKSNLTARRGALIFAVTYFLVAFLLSFFLSSYFSFLKEISAGVASLTTAESLMFGPVMSVALAHVIFNMLAMGIGFLLRPTFIKCAEKLLPEPKEKQPQHLRFLGRPSHLAPSLAIEQANQEVKKLAAMVHSMLVLTQELFSGNEESNNRVKKYESITDNILEELTIFISKVMQASLSKAQSFEAAGILQTAIELEKIADCCEDVLDYHQASEKLGSTPADLLEFLNSAIEAYEHIFPLITNHVNTNKEAMTAFIEDLDAIIHQSVKVYDNLIEKGLRQRADYEETLVAVNSIRRIIEGSRSIVELQKRFLISLAEFELM